MRVSVKLVRLKINFPDIDGVYTVVAVSGVVVNSVACVTARGVYGNFVFVAVESVTAARLRYAAEYVEKLIHALLFRFTRNRIQFCKNRPYKARLRRQIAGQPGSTQTFRIIFKFKLRRKGVFRLPGRKIYIVIQVERLHIKRRIVGQHPRGVIVNFNPFQ